jgi:hypothetical protein
MSFTCGRTGRGGLGGLGGENGAGLGAGFGSFGRSYIPSPRRGRLRPGDATQISERGRNSEMRLSYRKSACFISGRLTHSLLTRPDGRVYPALLCPSSVCAPLSRCTSQLSQEAMRFWRLARDSVRPREPLSRSDCTIPPTRSIDRRNLHCDRRSTISRLQPYALKARDSSTAHSLEAEQVVSDHRNYPESRATRRTDAGKTDSIAAAPDFPS